MLNTIEELKEKISNGVIFYKNSLLSTKCEYCHDFNFVCGGPCNGICRRGQYENAGDNDTYEEYCENVHIAEYLLELLNNNHFWLAYAVGISTIDEIKNIRKDLVKIVSDKSQSKKNIDYNTKILKKINEFLEMEDKDTKPDQLLERIIEIQDWFKPELSAEEMNSFLGKVDRNIYFQRYCYEMDKYELWFIKEFIKEFTKEVETNDNRIDFYKYTEEALLYYMNYLNANNISYIINNLPEISEKFVLEHEELLKPHWARLLVLNSIPQKLKEKHLDPEYVLKYGYSSFVSNEFKSKLSSIF